MQIKVLICRADGTQVIEEREAPDDWMTAPEEKTPEPKEKTE